MHIHGSNFLYYFIGIEHAINAYQTIKPHEKKKLQENTNRMNFKNMSMRNSRQLFKFNIFLFARQTVVN